MLKWQYNCLFEMNRCRLKDLNYKICVLGTGNFRLTYKSNIYSNDKPSEDILNDNMKKMFTFDEPLPVRITIIGKIHLLK